jgi:hypothetical protein
MNEGGNACLQGGDVSRSLLGFTATVWTFYFYAVLDCVEIWNTGRWLVPDDPHACCPNENVQAMNRYDSLM